MPYLAEFLTIVTIHLLAVMSPGPDFVMTVRNSLMYSRKTGIYSAIGLGFGIGVHVAYSLLGIGILISQSIVLFTIMKFVGAGYLFYIGYKSLTAKAPSIHIQQDEKREDIDRFAAMRMGFITNVTNPKATLFFLALFTQVIHPTTPLGIKLLYGLEMMGATVFWFTFVAVLLSHNVVKKRFERVQHTAERVMGAILIALGIKLVLSSLK